MILELKRAEEKIFEIDPDNFKISKIDGSRYVNTEITSAGKTVRLWSDISIDDISNVIVENSELKKFVLNFYNELELHCLKGQEALEIHKIHSSYKEWFNRVVREAKEYIAKHYGNAKRQEQKIIVMNRESADYGITGQEMERRHLESKQKMREKYLVNGVRKQNEAKN